MLIIRALILYMKSSKPKKEDKLANLKEFNKVYKYKYIPAEIDLVTNTEWCKKITKSACWRPDIYLDNDKSCGPCNLYDNCECAIKYKKGDKRHKETN